MKKILYTIEVSSEQMNKLNQITNCKLTFMNKADCTYENTQEYDAVIGGIDIQILNQLPNLKWLHLESSGADKYAVPLNPSVLLTNSTGAYSQAIAEYMLGGVLHFYKRFNEYILNQQNNNWQPLGTIDSLMNKTVCIIGYGDIGQTFAKYLKAFNCTIIGVKRNLNKPLYADEVVTMKDIKDVLPQADIVACILPKTSESINLINEEVLRTCKKEAIFINVGRGDTVVTEDLVTLINEGYFKGILLDVVNPEPLTPNHPLWSNPRVFITPHVSGAMNMKENCDIVDDIAYQNIVNYCTDNPLINIVDRRTGYRKSEE